MDIRFTNKQVAILTAIKDGCSDGTHMTVFDIIDFVFYDVKRDAMLHSLKILIDNGFVERCSKINSKGRRVRCFKITPKAEMYM